MTEAILSAEGVRKSYLSGDRKIEVLSGVALAVSAGQSVSIRGESGSGKSTLLNLLAGLDTPDEGRILWGSLPTLDASRRATYLGMVFQSFYLIPELDSFQNVLMARRMVGRITGEEKKRADDLLARVGLTDRRRHLPNQLSGGERQRVAVARALMNRPPLLLADEPTGNLDERTGDAVIELLLNVCRETATALVLVTHNAAHAAKTSRQLHLTEGRMDGRADGEG
jgi:putative ABC transport system ATP-binding protein/lipoprotein-releasing system ATP-binding protein